MDDLIGEWWDRISHRIDSPMELRNVLVWHGADGTWGGYADLCAAGSRVQMGPRLSCTDEAGWVSP